MLCSLNFTILKNNCLELYALLPAAFKCPNMLAKMNVPFSSPICTLAVVKFKLVGDKYPL
jgi:hypothetical protein